MDKKLQHYSTLPAAIDMAPYAQFYQAIARDIASKNLVSHQETVIVEAGVRHGCSARILMEAVADYADWSLHLIDPAPRDEAFECADDLHVSLYTRKAEDAAREFADRSVDLLHIDVDADGTHPYQLTKDVFEAFLPKLKPGAQVIFHDATESFPGVLGVINELVATGQWRVTHCPPRPACPIAAPALLQRIV